MKRKISLPYWRMLLTVCGLLVLGCEEETLLTKVPTTDQGFEKSIQAAQKADVFPKMYICQLNSQILSLRWGGIHFAGDFHWNIDNIIDAKGGFHSVFIKNDHSISGIGLTSGIKYHQVGATRRFSMVEV